MTTNPTKPPLPLASYEYDYKPLPENRSIRVLQLLPGEPDDEIHCRVHHATLDDAEDTYEAISYAWGDAANRTAITCDGKAMQITVSLADALRALRDQHRSKRLWADAICINQQDVAEKSHQVSQMGEVYENAREVVVWLGNDTDGVARRCFDLINKTKLYLLPLFEIHGPYVEQIPAIALPDALSGRSDLCKIRDMLSLPWFKRVWVIQEVAVAKECVMAWGSHRIEMAQVAELVHWWAFREDLTPFNTVFLAGYGTFVTTGYQTYANDSSWLRTRGLPLTKSRHGQIKTDSWRLPHISKWAENLRQQIAPTMYTPS